MERMHRIEASIRFDPRLEAVTLEASAARFERKLVRDLAAIAGRDLVAEILDVAHADLRAGALESQLEADKLFRSVAVDHLRSLKVPRDAECFAAWAELVGDDTIQRERIAFDARRSACDWLTPAEHAMLAAIAPVFAKIVTPAQLAWLTTHWQREAPKSSALDWLVGGGWARFSTLPAALLALGTDGRLVAECGSMSVTGLPVDVADREAERQRHRDGNYSLSRHGSSSRLDQIVASIPVRSTKPSNQEKHS